MQELTAIFMIGITPNCFDIFVCYLEITQSKLIAAVDNSISTRLEGTNSVSGFYLSL